MKTVLKKTPRSRMTLPASSNILTASSMIESEFTPRPRWHADFLVWLSLVMSLTSRPFNPARVPISHQAAAIFLGSTVTKEGSVLGIGNLVILVAHLGTHCAHTHPINHLAGVAVVPMRDKSQQMNPEFPTTKAWQTLTQKGELFLPMLVHEFLLSDGESAQFIAKRIFILQR